MNVFQIKRLIIHLSGGILVQVSSRLSSILFHGNPFFISLRKYETEAENLRQNIRKALSSPKTVKY